MSACARVAGPPRHEGHKVRPSWYQAEQARTDWKHDGVRVVRAGELDGNNASGEEGLQVACHSDVTPM